MRCIYCKKTIRDDAVLCPACGRKIPRCPTCSRVITRRDRYCPTDGTRLPDELLAQLPANLDPSTDGGTRKVSRAMVKILAAMVLVLVVVVGFLLFGGRDHPVGGQTQPGTDAAVEAVTEAPTEAPTETPTEELTEEPVQVSTGSADIPCTALIPIGDMTEILFNEPGQQWYLSFEVIPENCTDELYYVFSEENVSVDDGWVTAVSEGISTVNIICGSQRLDFTIICSFSSEFKSVPLETEHSDITFRNLNESYQVELLNGLSPSEASWMTRDESVVTVDANGKITCVGWGRTEVFAFYGDQQIIIICRCVPPS